MKNDENRNTETARVTVSLPGPLVERLDEMARRKGYANRSAAMADLLRAQLVEHHQEAENEEAVGTVTLVFDHHKPRLQETLTNIQHDHGDGLILSTVHAHLDHDHCLEVILVRGAAGRIRRLADRLTTARGVLHGRLTVTATGRDLSAAAGEGPLHRHISAKVP